MNALTALVLAALQAALPANARVELKQFRPSGACAATSAEVRQAVRGSGAVAVRLSGPNCVAWGWADVSVFVPAQQLVADAREGQPVKAQTTERELTAGRTYVSSVAETSVAARMLPKGTVLEPQHLRSAGPSPGSEITVVARSGALTLTQRARVIGCPGSRICAQLGNGRRVTGDVQNGTLFVEIP